MLTGGPGSGKTTTLNMVYDELVDSGKATVISPKKRFGCPEDFRCILQYGDKKVGMFTEGDYAEDIIYAIGYCEGAGCDVLLVANRNKARPLARVSGDSSNVVLEKTMPLSDASNLTDMNRILQHI